MAQPLKSRSASCSGFTLVELAIVVAVVALLLGGLLVTVSGQIEVQRTRETRETLERVREALIGFAAANGRLPCPATTASNGAEAPAGGGTCTNTSGAGADRVVNGFVPAATLGLTPTDSQGYVLDGWGNRLRYSVWAGSTTSSGPCAPQSDVFTTSDEMRTVTMPCLMDTATLLSVCATASGITASTCGTAVSLTAKAPALIYSLGKNGATGGTGPDEAANPNPNSANNDRVFVFHDLAVGGAGGEFDDMMTWLSLPVLFNRMIAAGRLP